MTAPSTTAYRHTPNRSISVQGVDFTYRALGPDDGVPLVLLHHLSGALDDWDPRVVDGLAARRRVIAFDNRGVGSSGGATPATIEGMAHDAVLFIGALGLRRVDLLGASMGGFVAQVVAAKEPDLVRRVIVSGAGPAGGPGIDKVTSLTLRAAPKAALHRTDARRYLFFTGTANGQRAADAFLARLQERTEDRDKAISLRSLGRQLKAVSRWSKQPPADLSGIVQPVLVVHGEQDTMVPSTNALDLARRLPHAELVPLYPDAGHGGIFQCHEEFVPRALEFLASSS